MAHPMERIRASRKVGRGRLDSAVTWPRVKLIGRSTAFGLVRRPPPAAGGGPMERIRASRKVGRGRLDSAVTWPRVKLIGRSTAFGLVRRPPPAAGGGPDGENQGIPQSGSDRYRRVIIPPLGQRRSTERQISWLSSVAAPCGRLRPQRGKGLAMAAGEKPRTAAKTSGVALRAMAHDDSLQ